MLRSYIRAVLSHLTVTLPSQVKKRKEANRDESLLVEVSTKTGPDC